MKRRKLTPDDWGAAPGPVSARTQLIREQQRGPAGPVTAVMVSPAPLPFERMRHAAANCQEWAARLDG